MLDRIRFICRQLPILLAAVLLGLIVRSGVAADRSVGAASTAKANDPDHNSSDARIKELIRQLGSPEFAVRRAAAGEIRRIGPEAFDQLHAATDDTDPEIVASASYLLRQIDVRWTRTDDSATVRRLMRGYGDRDDKDRQSVIQMLAGLPEREGVAGMCRIARFDRTPILSRFAALAIVQADDAADDEQSTSTPLDPEIIDRELGESTRDAALWLRQYQIQLSDPAASVSGWQRLIDEETKRLDIDVQETSPALVSALLWNLADVHRRLGETGPLVAVSDRLLALGGADSDRLIGTILQWFVQHESWDALDQFATSHDERIQKSKRTLYLLALARAKQDDSELAEELAARASKLEPAEPFAGLDAANLLAALGQFDWSVREYQIGIDGVPIETASAIGSRVLLSNLLQDYERYDAAAGAIEPLVTAIEKNRDIGRAYEAARGQLAQQGHYLSEAETLPARMRYLRACHYEQEHDFKHQRKELLAAIQADETDADVLIAMFRVGDADDAWMADTRERIQKLSKEIEEKIEESPDDSISYNQWAWLVANTEGDFPKAVRYSRRSLELDPGTPSFLDTLGRCYYSAGDYEKAVESQCEAVRLIPHMQVMQRQLKVFEKTLAEKKKSATTD